MIKKKFVCTIFRKFRKSCKKPSEFGNYFAIFTRFLEDANFFFNFQGTGGSYPSVSTGGCCETCYKVEGEPCGRLWGLDGECRKGLVCKIEVESKLSQGNDPTGVCRISHVSRKSRILRRLRGRKLRALRKSRVLRRLRDPKSRVLRMLSQRGINLLLYICYFPVKTFILYIIFRSIFQRRSKFYLCYHLLTYKTRCLKFPFFSFF